MVQVHRPKDQDHRFSQRHVCVSATSHRGLAPVFAHHAKPWEPFQLR